MKKSRVGRRVINESVFRPVWFKIFISKLEKGVNCGISNFTDDSKLFREIKYHAAGKDHDKNCNR